MASILQESPIHPHCGGRMILPVLLANIIAGYCSSMLIFFIVLEAMFWVDKFFGFEKLWGFSHVSIFIQRYFTTQEPADYQVRTAEAGIQALVKAHQ
jgi:uncharacterized protein YqhQ